MKADPERRRGGRDFHVGGTRWFAFAAALLQGAKNVSNLLIFFWPCCLFFVFLCLAPKCSGCFRGRVFLGWLWKGGFFSGFFGMPKSKG